VTVATPTFNQIKARVAAVRQKLPHAKVVGIHSLGSWSGPSQERDGELAYVVHQCDSPLAMRQALRKPAVDGTIKILVTPLDDKDLSEDILVRLAKQRLFSINSWEIVRNEFQAHLVDPRLAGHGWMADMLLELRPPEGYPAARGGFLDAETVWPLLLRLSIGLAAEAPDATALLKWSLDEAAVSRYRLCPPEFREGARGWLAEKAGAVAEIVLQSIERLGGGDTLPIGLAAGVVFHPAALGKLEKATGKFEERYLAGQSPQPGLMLRWSAAATEVVRALWHTQPKAYRQVLERADAILIEIQAEAFAHCSDTSLAGFDQRLARVGKGLLEVLQSKAWEQDAQLDALREVVAGHDLAAREANRMERMEMAVRLVRWLGEQRGRPSGTGPRSLGEAAVEHLRQGGFVDWARLCLRVGDPVRELSESYARLFEQVTSLREQQAQTFARLLADWTAAGSQGDDVIPVERVLEQVVAPLAASQPVLLIVIDGMSVAICRELLADLTRHEWIALCQLDRSFNRPAIATIPSVTEFSRTSLLCGSLRQGSMADEKAGFAEHAALLAHCRNGSPPVLFHKAGLQEGEDAVLAPEVRREIASAHRKIVGVVINAVDDHLLKGEQIDTHWSREAIKVLPSLLYEARIARRLVVLVSDHGHVLDFQTQGREGDGGERWRTASGAPGADELLVEGPRVLVAGHRLVAPWSERVRYGMKKNGYHGGLTPQEMVIAIAVLASTEDFPAGWQCQPVDTPAWWDEFGDSAASALRPAPVLKPAVPRRRETLFDLAEEESRSPQPPTDAPALVDREAVPDWVRRLLAGPVFAEQKLLGGRALPDNEVLSKLLVNLDRRGGKMTSVALARALDFAALRLPGLLAKAQRLLNVDGYAVLSRDDVSDTVELNRDLLLTQFDLVQESQPVQEST
jgi:hypothetical protein